MSESRGWTRREALGILGMGVAAAALPEFASAAAPTFPKGAVIRTILKDYAPDELAGGATLFHEHMSFADNFMTRWTGYAIDTRRETAMPGAPAPGAREGAGRQGGAAAAAPPSTPSGQVLHAGPRLHDRGDEDRQGRRHQLHRRRRPCGHGPRHQLPAAGVGEVGAAYRGRRRVLHAAVLSEGNLRR